jgi:hypothetical protein
MEINGITKTMNYIEYTNGTKEWFLDGKCHREAGPAIEYPSGYKVWYLDDKEINCKTNEEFLKFIKYKWLI